AAPEAIVIVTVTTPVGTSSDTAGPAFHYWVRPTILSVSPASGSVQGNQFVTVTIAHAGGYPVSVALGGRYESFTLVGNSTDDPSSVTFFTQPHPAGPASL